MTVLYEDNHIIIVNKTCNEIVQGDKTGDITLIDMVKQYIKDKYNKQGEVFLGLAHRIDRPTSGIVVFARTSKALTRLNDMFRSHELIKKTYWAIISVPPKMPQALLTDYIVKNEKQNKSYIVPAATQNAKQAVLSYKTIAHSERYTLLEIALQTGRHHQIRCQLAAIGCPIKGDLKYGAKRSNPDGGISLHARSIEFVHPVSKCLVHVTAPMPDDNLWHAITADIVS